MQLMVAHYYRQKNLIWHLYTKYIQRLLVCDSSSSQDFASKLPIINYHPQILNGKFQKYFMF